jgi:TRAP-type C4-dicarboxylate transport system permease small subunit
MLDTIIDRCLRLFSHMTGLLLALMVILVFGNVVLRYGFDSGITLSEELARWMFVWMTFLGAVVALREREHLGTEFLTNRLSPSGRRGCSMLARAVMLGCCVLLSIGAWRQASLNLGSRSAVMDAPLAWLDAAVFVFAAMGLLVLLAQGRSTAHTDASEGPSESRPTGSL